MWSRQRDIFCHDSITLLCSELIKANNKSSFYGFDSFEDFLKPTKEDLEGKGSKGHYSLDIKTVNNLLKTI